MILVRHGESEGNARGLLLGRIDSPLTERGLGQARALSDTVAGASRLISSPLARARDTADALGTGLPVEIDERWIEVDYGELDGQKLGDVPAVVWKRWRSDPTYAPPGGESLAAAGARVREACARLSADPDGPARGDGTVVVVSHVSPIKAAACWSLGLGDEGAWRLYLATGSVTRITWGQGGTPVLAGFNPHALDERPLSGRTGGHAGRRPHRKAATRSPGIQGKQIHIPMATNPFRATSRHTSAQTPKPYQASPIARAVLATLEISPNRGGVAQHQPAGEQRLVLDEQSAPDEIAREDAGYGGQPRFPV